MNALHVEVLKMSAKRYFRGTMLLPVIIMCLAWIANFAVGLNTAGRISLAIVATFAFALLFSGFYWQYGWAVGNVDPITGLHTEKFKKDRLYIAYLTSLPLDRKTHYSIQVLLYVFLSLTICLFSYCLQAVSTMAQDYPALFAYMHLLLFATLIFFGGLQTLMVFPLAFRGSIKNYKHPLALLGLILWIPFMVVFAMSSSKRDVFSLQSSSDILVQVITHPALLTVLLIAGPVLLFAGGYVFSKVDIR